MAAESTKLLIFSTSDVINFRKNNAASMEESRKGMLQARKEGLSGNLQVVGKQATQGFGGEHLKTRNMGVQR